VVGRWYLLYRVHKCRLSIGAVMVAWLGASKASVVWVLLCTTCGHRPVKEHHLLWLVISCTPVGMPVTTYEARVFHVMEQMGASSTGGRILSAFNNCRCCSSSSNQLQVRAEAVGTCTFEGKLLSASCPQQTLLSGCAVQTPSQHAAASCLVVFQVDACKFHVHVPT
jgi:hypothetical protein